METKKIKDTKSPGDIMILGYCLAIRHFKERLEMGQSFQGAVREMKSIEKTLAP